MGGGSLLVSKRLPASECQALLCCIAQGGRYHSEHDILIKFLSAIRALVLPRKADDWHAGCCLLGCAAVISSGKLS